MATAVFPDRDSVELFLKLSLQVLQDWLSIRQGEQAIKAALNGRMGSTWTRMQA